MKLDASKLAWSAGARGSVEEGPRRCWSEAPNVLVGRSRDKLQTTSKALAGPPRVKAIVADVTREEDVVRMFAEVGSFDRRCDPAVMRS